MHVNHACPHKGAIWQAYTVQTEKEVKLLTKSALHNGFHVENQAIGYADETTPGWRHTQDWQDYIAGRLSERAKGQAEVREVVSCFSLRSLADLHGFTPIACWSELTAGRCQQWLVLRKDGQVFVDYLDHCNRTDYGVKPVLATELTYPSHIFDWVDTIRESPNR